LFGISGAADKRIRVDRRVSVAAGTSEGSGSTTISSPTESAGGRSEDIESVALRFRAMV